LKQFKGRKKSTHCSWHLANEQAGTQRGGKQNESVRKGRRKKVPTSGAKKGGKRFEDRAIKKEPISNDKKGLRGENDPRNRATKEKNGVNRCPGGSKELWRDCKSRKGGPQGKTKKKKKKENLKRKKPNYRQGNQRGGGEPKRQVIQGVVEKKKRNAFLGEQCEQGGKRGGGGRERRWGTKGRRPPFRKTPRKVKQGRRGKGVGGKSSLGEKQKKTGNTKLNMWGGWEVKGVEKEAD